MTGAVIASVIVSFPLMYQHTIHIKVGFISTIIVSILEFLFVERYIKERGMQLNFLKA